MRTDKIVAVLSHHEFCGLLADYVAKKMRLPDGRARVFFKVADGENPDVTVTLEMVHDEGKQP